MIVCRVLIEWPKPPGGAPTNRPSRLRIIQRVAIICRTDGRFLFTACWLRTPVLWNDAVTGLESRALGFEEYQRELSSAGLSLVGKCDDQGENHYLDAIKT